MKARSITIFLLTNLGNCCDAAQKQILSELMLHREGSLLLKKAFLILFNQHWLRSWHYSWEDPLNLTVVAEMLSWALLVDVRCLNFLVESWRCRLTRWVLSRGTCTRTQQPLPSFMVGNNFISWFLYDEIVERCEVPTKIMKT